MTNKLVVHKITDVVEADWEILGVVAKSPNGDAHIGEVAFDAIVGSGFLMFTQATREYPDPVRIGPESDHGVLLQFASDTDRNKFLALFTKEQEHPPSGADMVHLETATNGDKVCILKTPEGVYWVVTYDSAWLTKAVVSEIAKFPEALGALKTTLARMEK